MWQLKKEYSTHGCLNLTSWWCSFKYNWLWGHCHTYFLGHAYLSRPGPLNFYLSLQYLREPQSLLHPSHLPYLIRTCLLPTYNLYLYPSYIMWNYKYTANCGVSQTSQLMYIYIARCSIFCLVINYEAYGLIFKGKFHINC